MEGDELSLLSSVLLDRATRAEPGDIPRELGVDGTVSVMKQKGAQQLDAGSGDEGEQRTPIFFVATPDVLARRMDRTAHGTHCNLEHAGPLHAHGCDSGGSQLRALPRRDRGDPGARRAGPVGHAPRFRLSPRDRRTRANPAESKGVRRRGLEPLCQLRR